MENNDVLKEKIESLASDTIMGVANNSTTSEAIEKLQRAVEENQEENTEVKTLNNAITGEQLEALKNAGYFRKTRPIVRDNKKIGRNDPCPCGATDINGKPKKYKNCCMNTGKYDTTHYE